MLLLQVMMPLNPLPRTPPSTSLHLPPPPSTSLHPPPPPRRLQEANFTSFMQCVPDFRRRVEALRDYTKARDQQHSGGVGEPDNAAAAAAMALAPSSASAPAAAAAAVAAANGPQLLRASSVRASPPLPPVDSWIASLYDGPARAAPADAGGGGAHTARGRLEGLSHGALPAPARASQGTRDDAFGFTGILGGGSSGGWP